MRIDCSMGLYARLLHDEFPYRNRRTGETGELPVNGLLDAIRSRLA